MGNNLFNSLISATGLPTESVSNELTKLLAKNGKTPETMTLDDLREVMADYLQTVLVEAKEELSA